MSINIEHLQALAEAAEQEGLVMVPIRPSDTLELIKRLQELEAEWDALAAHVERLRAVAENMDHFNDDEDMAEAEAALSDSGDTLDEVFARRDAANKAEELELLLSITRNDDAGEAIRAVMFDRIKKLRRQAEEE